MELMLSIHERMMDISDRALESVMDWLLETSQPFFEKMC